MWCPCDCLSCIGERCSGKAACRYSIKCIARPFPKKAERVTPVDWDKATPGKSGYRLLDAVLLGKQYPGTFKIPNSIAKANLRPNDFVKLFFEDSGMPDYPERLWVQVGTWDRNYGGVGRIANVPFCISATYGDKVKFQAWNIMQIMLREDYNARGGLQVPAVMPKRLALCAKVED